MKSLGFERKMRFNSKKTRLSAVCHIMLESLCFIFGFFDQISIYKYSWRAFQTQGVIAIWMGVWFLITGVIGYLGSQPYPNTQRPLKSMISTYLGVSFVTTVLGGVMLICCSVGLSYIPTERPCTRYEYKCYGYYRSSCRHEEVPDSECWRGVGLGAMIIIFAVVEFCVGIWASVCCCMGYDGCRCDTSPPEIVSNTKEKQVVHVQNQGGPVAAYVTTQGTNGLPVAVPAMTGGPVLPVPNQAVGGQEYMMRQNQQAATPTQYVHAAGGKVHVQNVQAAATVIPTQQFLITGVIGYFASKPYPNTQRPKMAMISTYLGFSIVATVFAGVLLICYSVGLSDITRGKSCTRYRNKCDYSPYYNCQNVKVTDSKCQTSVGLGAMIIIFAVVEFGVGIWASVCCCMGYDSCCGDTSQPQTQGQVVYLQTQGGAFAAYVMTQGPNGMPAAVPAMTGGPVYSVPNQAVGGQGYVIQNPQAATPTQYVQGAGGQVYMQNPQGTAIVRPLQQDVATSGDQQPAVKTTDASSQLPPAYTP